MPSKEAVTYYEELIRHDSVPWYVKNPIDWVIGIGKYFSRLLG